MTQDERARLLDEGDKRAMGLGVKFACYFKAVGWEWSRADLTRYVPTAGDVRRLIRRLINCLRDDPACHRISSSGIDIELVEDADGDGLHKLFICFSDAQEVGLPEQAA